MYTEIILQDLTFFILCNIICYVILNNTIMSKKLYRLEEDKIIGGVCSGLAEYLDIDSSIVRIAFLLIFFFGGSGLLIYFIMWIIIPAKPSSDVSSEKVVPTSAKKIEKKVETETPKTKNKDKKK